MITIIDYGMGNLGSIMNILKRVGAVCSISTSPKDIESASKIILPGVGAFDNGIRNLKKMGYYEVIESMVKVNKIPILGICLGMQLLTNGSEEGIEKGFGFIDAYTYKFKFGETLNYKIPHMGWNTLIVKKSNCFFEKDKEYRFYFVHSFNVKCNNPNDILTTTCYGYEFTSAIEKENVLGVQFHPEKSHRYGIDFYKKFVEIKQYDTKKNNSSSTFSQPGFI